MQKIDSSTPLVSLPRTKSDEKLKLAQSTIPAIQILIAPIEARTQASILLSGLDQAQDGTFHSQPAGMQYERDIGGWLKDATNMSQNLDVQSIKIIGDTLARAVTNNLALNKAGNEELKKSVNAASVKILGGEQPVQKLADGRVIPAQHRLGLVELPYSTPQWQASYLFSENSKSDAIAAVKLAGESEAKAKGWSLSDVAKNDPQFAALLSQYSTGRETRESGTGNAGDFVATMASGWLGTKAFSTVLSMAEKIPNPYVRVGAAVIAGGLAAFGGREVIDQGSQAVFHTRPHTTEELLSQSLAGYAGSAIGKGAPVLSKRFLGESPNYLARTLQSTVTQSAEWSVWGMGSVNPFLKNYATGENYTIGDTAINLRNSAITGATWGVASPALGATGRGVWWLTKKTGVPALGQSLYSGVRKLF